MVPGHLGVRLVRDADRGLLHVLRIVWRRHCHAGVALPVVVQRLAGSRTEWSSFPGTARAKSRRRSLQIGFDRSVTALTASCTPCIAIYIKGVCGPTPHVQ